MKGGHRSSIPRDLPRRPWASSTCGRAGRPPGTTHRNPGSRSFSREPGRSKQAMAHAASFPPGAYLSSETRPAKAIAAGRSGTTMYSWPLSACGMRRRSRERGKRHQPNAVVEPAGIELAISRECRHRRLIDKSLERFNAPFKSCLDGFAATVIAKAAKSECSVPA